MRSYCLVCPLVGSSIQGRHLHTGESQQWAIKVIERLEQLPYKKWLRKLELLNLAKKKAQREAWRKLIPKGKVQRKQSRPFQSGVPWQDLKYGRFSLSIRKLLFTVRVSFLQNIKKLSGNGREQLDLGVSNWGGGLDKMASRGPFQPPPFYDSVTGVQKHVKYW